MIDYLRILLAARTRNLSARGASAVEYGLLVAGIAAVVLVAVFAFGDNLRAVFVDTCETIAAENTSPADACT